VDENRIPPVQSDKPEPVEEKNGKTEEIVPDPCPWVTRKEKVKQ